MGALRVSRQPGRHTGTAFYEMQAEMYAELREQAKDRLINCIEAAARARRVCPGNTALGKQASVGIKNTILLLRELREEGRIVVKQIRVGNCTGISRQVTVVASGLTTAHPSIIKPFRPRDSYAPQTDLEKAKTKIRQRGYIVYNASVTDGPRAGDMIKIDGRYFTPDQVISRAAALEVH